MNTKKQIFTALIFLVFIVGLSFITNADVWEGTVEVTDTECTSNNDCTDSTKPICFALRSGVSWCSCDTDPDSCGVGYECRWRANSVIPLCTSCISYNEICTTHSDCCGYTSSTGGDWCDFNQHTDSDKGRCRTSSDCLDFLHYSVTCPVYDPNCVHPNKDRACCTASSFGVEGLTGGLEYPVIPY